MASCVLSFQLWSSRAEPSLRSQFTCLKELGFSDVQLHHNQYDDPAGFRALLDETGLTARTAHAHYNLIDQSFEKVVQAARTIGIELIVAPFPPRDRCPVDRAGWVAFGERLRAFGRRLEAEGLRFAWHNHQIELQPLPDGSYPIEHLLGDSLLWEIDIGWLALAGADPAVWLRRYAGRIPAIHVKDLAPAGQKLDEDGWENIGQGTLPWQDIWPAAVSAGVQFMVAEHDAPHDYRRFAAASIKTMQRLAAGDAR